MHRNARAVVLASIFASLAVAQSGCAWGAGKNWVNDGQAEEIPRGATGDPTLPPAGHASSRSLNGPRENSVQDTREPQAVAGTILGTFRNTYYDFPSEKDFSGASVDLMSASCAPIAKVPRGFYDAVCVQGSGRLGRGATVSFAKRDCACALTCDRTGQRICFEELDATRFPFGRGASGQAIRPLVSVAADTKVIPMGTVIYVQEFDGIVLPGDGSAHDGCFIVEDRGGAVKGEHIDIFTGTPDVTREVNKRIPSNQGVTVLRDVDKCKRLAAI